MFNNDDDTKVITKEELKSITGRYFRISIELTMKAQTKAEAVEDILNRCGNHLKDTLLQVLGEENIESIEGCVEGVAEESGTTH